MYFTTYVLYTSVSNTINQRMTFISIRVVNYIELQKKKEKKPLATKIWVHSVFIIQKYLETNGLYL